ncbi:MAG: glycolate oxidase binding subunit [Acidimicrobiaceae bacterium]|nr:glycolate oxidase binding subunit [Acidimicrobiaceae bacterium]
MTVAGGAGVRGVVDPVLEDFARVIGRSGPVAVAGGRTQWSVGGPCPPGTRVVSAPAGVVAHEPAEMIVRVRAGTTVGALNSALAEGGQMVPLDPADPSLATVGGVLAVGHSGVRRLRYGPVRDTVLEVHIVSAAGEVVKAGGPVVKNVTGFDLCRLLVGSLGTLGLLAEVVLRCHPVPVASQWLRASGADPFGVLSRLYRPSSVLWDGTQVWVLLEGHPDDVAAQATSLGPTFTPVPGAPAAPGEGRISVPPGELRRLPTAAPGWLAHVGVGVVQTADPASLAAALGLAWPRALSSRVASLHGELKQRFDPSGRLNPGRQVGL